VIKLFCSSIFSEYDFIGFSTIEDTTVEKYQFTADRGTFKKLVFDKVLLLLEKFLG